MPVKTTLPAKLIQLLEPAFAAQAGRTAIVADSGELTYAQMRQRMDRMATQLTKNGVTVGSTVGLCLERSQEFIVSVMGIVRAGAAYVPIDPAYPADRIALMLEDSQPPVVITDRAHQHLFKGTKARVLLIDEIDLESGARFEDECQAKPENLAYEQ